MGKAKNLAAAAAVAAGPVDEFEAADERSLVVAAPNLTWCQCYTTFYGRKLRLFIISGSVSLWQAFLAYHRVEHLKSASLG
jgi:hypothetical protein